MNNVTIKCENCGTICSVKDGYCKNCWKKLAVDIEQDNFIIDGMGQSEWENFIDKNSNRYIDVYKKNNGKKIFLHINWSAFFFGLNWVLYRKMYKVAIIGFVITSLISLLLYTVFLLPYKEEIKVLNEDMAAYNAYLENGGKTILYDSQGEPYSPEIVETGFKAGRELFEIEAQATLNTSIIIPLTCVFWGLFGDAIYKMYILKNIKNKKGGASVAELIAGRILLSIIELLLVNPLTSIILVLLTK